MADIKKQKYNPALDLQILDEGCSTANLNRTSHNALLNATARLKEFIENHIKCSGNPKEKKKESTENG